ncbi:DUF1254 domain-containing protein [Parvibaculum sp.]|uniref:DUF1254 domain-containing protein n=1 Tax=Parvibaculum sp. TaxID=2024848 RepID=UPI0027304E76|nr:DUF1214 domain-containing protein [Parvibaculum sp.]MDP2148103.1 DUF1214 domain-containing protein [Parvibaculum sp.]MDP3329357.1 DUF1214 domain-containing protein [Parvibaculum sp.]
MSSAGPNTSVPSASGTNDIDARGLEALAYSIALQAYLFAFPLFITERERLRREKLTGPVPFEPAAPINQLGHMTALSSAKGDMPFSPNVDTVYTGVSLDLTKEPIILDMPAIKDRYAVVQVVNAYVENQPYDYSPRTNGCERTYIGFVGPDWVGELPEGVKERRLDTNLGGIAVRIAAKDEADLEIVRSYQAQMSLTPLSEWQDGPSGKPATPPAPRHRNKYEGDFAWFKEAADLLAENPPPPNHKVIATTLWRIGIAPGEPFDPDTLDPATRAGVLRAEKDGPAMIEYLFKNRGRKFPNGWDTARYSRDFTSDYAARAAAALVGLMGNDPEEAIYLYTYYDSNGDPLDGSKHYRIHVPADRVPQTSEIGFWSITMYDGRSFQFVGNSIDRYCVSSRDTLVANEDGSADIWIQADAPGGARNTNWLPSPKGGPFRVTCRIYSPVQKLVDEFLAMTLALPPLEPVDS